MLNLNAGKGHQVIKLPQSIAILRYCNSGRARGVCALQSSCITCIKPKKNTNVSNDNNKILRTFKVFVHDKVFQKLKLSRIWIRIHILMWIKWMVMNGP